MADFDEYGSGNESGSEMNDSDSDDDNEIIPTLPSKLKPITAISSANVNTGDSDEEVDIEDDEEDGELVVDGQNSDDENALGIEGDDEPQYKIEINWVDDRRNKLWVHCKNTEVMEFFNKFNYNINYFWHQNDNIILTSKKFLWVHPGKQPINNSIAVLPELYNDNIKKCIGICSDFIIKYDLLN